MIEFFNNLFECASRRRIFFSTLMAIGFFFFAIPGPKAMVSGLPVIILGEAIRVWASGHIEKNVILTAVGPYSLSRNPLYVGNFFLGAGFMVAAGSFWLFLVYLVLFRGLYSRTIRNEEEFLSGKFPEEWEEYASCVPRYISLTGMSNYKHGIFRWHLVVQHRELNNWFGIGIAYLLLVGKMYYLSGV